MVALQSSSTPVHVAPVHTSPMYDGTVKLGMGRLSSPCKHCYSSLGYVDIDGSITCAMCSRELKEGTGKLLDLPQTSDVIYHVQLQAKPKYYGDAI